MTLAICGRRLPILFMPRPTHFSLLYLLPLLALGQNTRTPPDLADMSLEELMLIDINWVWLFWNDAPRLGI